MKLDLNHLSAILAIDPATATPPPSQPVGENAVVIGTLPPQLIQLCSYQSIIIEKANARIDEIQAQVDKFTDEDLTDHTKIDTFMEEGRNLKKFAAGYKDFFWFCVKQHFELKNADERLTIGENWSVISELREACSCANCNIEQFFGHDVPMNTRGKGFFIITPLRRKNSGA